MTNPDTLTQRYGRLARRLGRHYSATELIAAGVDIRTVAGRLGSPRRRFDALRTFTLLSCWKPTSVQP